jgi:tRNA (guanosine-2'-O-)-methyltransferase
MTPERTEKLQRVLRHRQPNLTLVLENVFDPHNISAVMRTADSVGIQDIYVLNTKIPRHKKWGEKSSSSAAKWLTVHQYDDTQACFNALRTQGYKVLTTWLGEGSINLYQVDFTQPTAVVFGNEHSGVSDEIRALADGNMMIPQVGIIQSLNISVACAVTIYEAYRQKEKAGNYHAPQLAKHRYDALWEQWSLNQDL